MLSPDFIRTMEDEMDRECSIHESDEGCVHKFGLKTSRKESL